MKFLQQKLKIYNTKTGKKEIFIPIKSGFVGIYVCGPTVYNKIHLGNLRTFIFFDLVNRYLNFLDYKVCYVRNITDITNIISHERHTFNQINIESMLDNCHPMAIAQKYTSYFHNIMDQFNTIIPNIEPCASGHITEQIIIIEKLIQNKFAYIVNGSVYFDIIEYYKYYSSKNLIKIKVEDLFINTRELDGQKEKKNPWDFALWKKANVDHIQKWTSPWGVGYPGWHIECTTMSNKYLGNNFDIHGGGIDLKFPHHQCEVMQAVANTDGIDPVNYWMHVNMLTLNGNKMSKSIGNFILPDQLILGNNLFSDISFNPMEIKFFLYQTHYQSILNISYKNLLASKKSFYRLNNAIKLLDILPISSNTSFDIKESIQSLYNAINDNFNSPVLISYLFKIAKIIQKIYSGIELINKEDYILLKTEVNNFFYKILGLNIIKEDTVKYFNKIIKILIKLRHQARLQKNWKLSDEIRYELLKKGIQLMDLKDKTIYKFIS